MHTLPPSKTLWDFSKDLPFAAPKQLIAHDTTSRLKITLIPGNTDVPFLYRTKAGAYGVQVQLEVLDGDEKTKTFRDMWGVSGDGKFVELGRKTIRTVIDSTFGLDPDDEACSGFMQRSLERVEGLQGLTFLGEVTIKMDPTTGRGRNRLGRIFTHKDPLYAPFMACVSGVPTPL